MTATTTTEGNDEGLSCQAGTPPHDLATILEQTGDGIAVFDAEGRFTFINRRASELLGRPASTLLHTRWGDLFPDAAGSAAFREPFFTCAHERVPVTFEAVLPNADRFLGCRCLPDEDGCVILLFRDVTERHEREQHLRAVAAELKRSNAALEEFAYIASHDLKEPLRKIQSFGDLLQRRAGDALTPSARDYVERMVNAAGRMQALVDGLLAYARAARTNDSATLPQPVDLNVLVREVLSDLEARLSETGGQVDVRPLPIVFADPLSLRQLFQNLIGNALKFRRPDISPFVIVREESDPTDPDTTLLIVQDNGIGFAPDQAERIFGLFERLEGRASSIEGTGVGLAICRKIVERHGGTLTARSIPEEGATFIICLPRRAGGKLTAA